MTISPKTKNWLMIGGAATILVILLIVLFSNKLNPTIELGNKLKQLTEPTTTPATEPTQQVYTADTIATDSQAPLDDRGRLEIQLEKKAGAFVERWANVSSQDNFSNLEILKNSMTESMVKWTDDYIKQRSADKKTNIYLGTQAQTIVTEGQLSANNAESIDINIKVRGQETIASTDGAAKSFYQDYRLTMVKDGSNWLADKLTWQNRQYQ